LAAAIRGVPTMLVSNLDVIWQTHASSQPINPMATTGATETKSFG
jgi:hypothetical protein